MMPLFGQNDNEERLLDAENRRMPRYFSMGWRSVDEKRHEAQADRIAEGPVVIQPVRVVRSLQDRVPAQDQAERVLLHQTGPTHEGV